MLRQQKRLFFWILGAAILLIVAMRILIFPLVSSLVALIPAAVPGVNPTSSCAKPANAVEISIIYAPESEVYLTGAMEDFDCNFAKGVNPLTGAKLAADERPIYITGKVGSSGTVQQGIINALVAPNNANVDRPTIFAPSVSHWPALVNYQTGREIFDLGECKATALTPVVMAIWESRLAALEKQNGGQPVGWEDLLAVMNAPNGWESVGIAGHKTVYYGHTNPYVSSTALSTLIAEFYASGHLHAQQTDFRRLTLDIVKDPAVQTGVRNIEAMIKHYSERTTEFKEYIAQGPQYLDFVALEENDLIYINQGKTAYKPPEKLVALYPKEGTFWHEHPFCVPNTDWVSPEQHAAAKVFTDYIRSNGVQQKVMAAGFRPVDLSIKLGNPFVKELGIDPLQPSTTLAVPSPEVIAAVQASWQYVKKQADVLLVMDTSGSMEGEKLAKAKAAAQRFLALLPSQNRVGLVTFSSGVSNDVPLNALEASGPAIRTAIDGLQASGDTALYDAIIAAVKSMPDDGEHIRAIVVLSDGQDTTSQSTLNDITALALGERNPILIFPVAYGSDADIGVLNTIARFAGAKVLSGDTKGIEELFTLMSSYF